MSLRLCVTYFGDHSMPQSRVQRSIVLHLLYIILFGIIGTAEAQTNTGNLRGRISDNQSAVISNASILLINNETSVSRSTVTNGSGDFLFTAVEPATYTVKVSFLGFAAVERRGVIVGLGLTVTVDEQLRPGSTGETVNVVDETPLIETASATNGQTYIQQQLQDLPNMGRNPFILEKLDNNVVPQGDPRYVRAEDLNGTTSVSVAGAPLGANTYVVDGIPISTSNGTVTFIPSLEAVADAKVQANAYDAEVGRTGGGVFNTTLKSGSEQYHGVLYGETRQTAWSANTWFGNHNSWTDSSGVSHQGPAPRPDNTTYLYTGAFGGPLPLSDRIHWLNNTFFWVAEDGYRQAQPYTGSTTKLYVPTAAERSGDFSADGITLYDPSSPLVGGIRSATFAGNKIPASSINPIGASIANAFPLPTANILYGSGQANYYGSDNFKTRSDEYSGKLDHVFAPWWSASASYVHNASQEPGGNILHVSAAARGVLTRYIDGTAVNNVFTLNPTTVLTVGYGFNRSYNSVPQYSDGFDQSTGFAYNGGTYGFPTGYTRQLQSKTYPTITLSGITNAATLGAASTGPTIQTSRNLVTGITKTLGKHNLRFGYVFRGLSCYNSPTTAGNGAFTFNGQYTSANGASISNGPQAIADLLLGLPSAASVTINATALNMNAHYHAAYVQDDFRVSSKLTFNLGLRYEYELGQKETSNRYNVGFDDKATYTFPGTNGNIPARGGLAFAGANGYPIHSGNQSHLKFAPRIGAAYELKPGTVLRGGFGLFYSAVGLSPASIGYSQTTSYSTGNVTSAVPAGPNAYLSNPFNTTLLAPSGNSLGLLTGIGGAVSAPSFDRKYPYVYQYSLDLQQELPYGIALKIGYVGAQAKNFPNDVNVNQLPDSVLAQYAASGVNLATKVTNPYYATTVGGYPSTGIIANSTVARAQTLLPFPQFTSVTLSKSNGHSLYNSLAVKLQKRLRNGVSLLVTYTWASNWDNFYGSPIAGLSTLNPNPGAQNYNNPEGEWARATNNIPNRFTAGLIWQLPIGRGKALFGGANRWEDALIGGWQLNDITILQNGEPLPVIQTNLNSGIYGTTGVGGTVQRPNLIAGISPCRTGRPQTRLGGGSGATPYFNLDAFMPAAPYTYGNAPRTLNCYGPGYSNSDISIAKDIKITERVNLQFRAEALNAFNTPQFARPDTALTFSKTDLASSTYTFTPSATNSSTGSITGQLGFSRIIQLGGRLSF
jgi:hypothetical protein